MSARAVLATALGAVTDWLVEPAEVPEQAERSPVRLEEHAVVAVVGLGRRCGTTTVARALGAELAVRDPGGACAVTAARSSQLPLGLPAAGRLARIRATSGGRTRACGRLCLVENPDRNAIVTAARRVAPLVLDVGEPAEAGAAASLADAVVLVASPSVEAALAPVVAESLARVGPRPIIVLNRGPGEPEWQSAADLELPESRMAATLALAGREPRGDMGARVSELADSVAI